MSHLTPHRRLIDLCPFADGILADPRGFHIPAGKDDKCPLAKKLTIQLDCDMRVLDIDKYLKAGVMIEDIINDFDEKVKKEGGWKSCALSLVMSARGRRAHQSFHPQVSDRAGCSHSRRLRRRIYPRSSRQHVSLPSLRLAICSFLLSSCLPSGSAIVKYRFALSLIEAGRERWSTVPGEERGSTFRFTFARNVKVHLMRASRLPPFLGPLLIVSSKSVALEEGWFKATTPSARHAFSLEEIQNLAEEIMDARRFLFPLFFTLG